MERLRLNREFAVRHLAVAALLLGMSGWFGYDGFVSYPRRDGSYFAERHLERETATRRQKEFMAITFLAAFAVAAHVFALSRFRFEFDDDGFVFGGRRRAYSDVKKIDRSRWEKKDIIVVDGIKLDAWHHCGVREFVERLDR